MNGDIDAPAIVSDTDEQEVIKSSLTFIFARSLTRFREIGSLAVCVSHDLLCSLPAAIGRSNCDPLVILEVLPISMILKQIRPVHITSVDGRHHKGRGPLLKNFIKCRFLFFASLWWARKPRSQGERIRQH